MEKTELPIEDNLIVKLSFQFSVNTIKFIDSQHWGNRFSICNQLLKSATSIGANIREAQNSESKNDFIHKFKIAAKEL
jgi:four helix bundle protein